MNKIIIEEVYTGGGCEHLSIEFVDYGVRFDIMNADEYCTDELPINGSPFCFNLCKSGSEMDGEYIQVSDRIENYHSDTIKDFCLGYLAALKLKPVEEVQPVPYDIDELFSSINDVYMQYDGGKITKEEANQIARGCCELFVLWYAQTNEGK
jgi:hypothetical protein